MLGRLQQVIVLVLTLQSTLWGAAGLFGMIPPALAWSGALLPPVIYAAALTFEFVTMRVINTRHSAPPATLAQAVRAWWGELCSGPLVFAWRQPFRSRRWPDRLSPPDPGMRGVLLVHGFVCNRGIWNAWLQRLDHLKVPFIAIDMEPVFGGIDEYLLQFEVAVSRLHQLTGLAPVVVAHSMGGLALRRWWSEPQNADRIHHAITLGTPHQGTWLARFAVSRNGKQMQIGSAWLQQLAAAERPALRRRMTCYYSHCDNIVFPALTATLPGASNRHLPGVAHVHMVASDEPYQELLRRLAERARTQTAAGSV